MLFSSLTADLTLDPKGRLMLPRPVRADLERVGFNRLVAFANGGPGRGLCLMPIGDFERMAEAHRAADPMDPRGRLFALAVSSTAQTIAVDGNGRVLVPPALRRMLGLERELHLFTAGAWIEVWDRTRWETDGFPKAADLWDRLFGFDSLAPAVGGLGEGM